MTMSASIPAWRRLTKRLALAASIGASLLLASTIEAAADSVPLQCFTDVHNINHPNEHRVLLVNTTGRTIPAGTRMFITICEKGNCRTLSVTTAIETPPGKWVWWNEAFNVELVPAGATCSASLWTPDGPFRRSVEVPKYTRVKPPGPPQPGLLEDSPGFSRQGPSGVGTPSVGVPKPSAPSTRPPGAPTLR